MIKKTLAAVTLGLTLASSWAQEINFGIISTESSQNLKSDWQPLLDDMAKQTGLKVKAFFAPDYLCQVESGYFESLSPASVASLVKQGGVFDASQCEEFIAQEHAYEAVRLRRYDDFAKVAGKQVPGLEHYLPRLQALMHGTA